jgi:molybdate transport system substrate-binding protein
MIKRAAAAPLLLAALLPAALAGCGEVEETPSGTGGGDGGRGGTLTVFAAASLTEAFTALGKTFEGSHPGVRVRFNFGGSSTLAQQITQGAPADVFASANPATMRTVTDAGDAGRPACSPGTAWSSRSPRTTPAGCRGCATCPRPG